MKRILLAAVLIALILTTGCKSKDKVHLNIDVNQIDEVSITTQMTNPVAEINLDKDKWEDVIDKLNSYSLKEIKSEDKKGWEYLFNIKTKDEVLQISLSEDRISVGEKEYKCNDYNSEDFIYLFEDVDNWIIKLKQESAI